MVWDTTAVRQKQTVAASALNISNVLSWSVASAGEAILSVHRDGWLNRWHGRILQQMEPLVQIEPSPKDVCFSSDQRFVASGTESGECAL